MKIRNIKNLGALVSSQGMLAQFDVVGTLIVDADLNKKGQILFAN